MLVKSFKRLYHACWYLFALVILITSVSVTLVRVSLPYINQYKDSLQTWVSEETGYTVAFDSINASWAGWKPYLVIQNIKISEPDEPTVITTFDSAKITLNPFIAILRQRVPPLSITVNGPELVLVRTSSGAFRISEKNQLNIDQTNNSGNNIFIAWLNQQRALAIHDATVTFIDENIPGTSLKMTEANLTFIKSSARLQVDLNARLPEEYGEQIQFLMDIVGDITSPEWSGKIYMMGKQLNPSSLSGYTFKYFPSFQITGDPVDLDIWSNWNKGKIDGINGSLNTGRSKLKIKEMLFNLDALDSKFSVNLRDQNKIFSKVRFDKLTTSNGTWPETNLDLSMQRPDPDSTYTYYGNLSYLNISDIPAMSEWKNSSSSYISEFDHIQGVLKDIKFEIDSGNVSGLYFSSKLQDLEISNSNNGKLLSGDQAELSVNANTGVISFDSSTLRYIDPEIIKAPVEFYDTLGQINWIQEDNRIVFDIPHLDATNPKFDTKLSGKVEVTNEDGQSHSYIDLLSVFTNVKLEDVEPYLPLHIHEDVHHWLQRALLSGEIPVIDIAYRGDPAQFPFKNNEGQFKVVASVEDARLEFAPDWLPIESLQTRFSIDNQVLSVNASSGILDKAEISNTTAIIEDLYTHPQVLKINGHVTATSEDALAIINNSPLQNSKVLNELSKIHPNGNIDLDLGLEIPLHPLEVNYQGTVEVNDMKVKSDVYGFSLKDINGSVSFSNNNVSTNQLNGKYSGQDVSINISSTEQDRINMQLGGISTPDFITSQLKHFFPGLGTSLSTFQSYITGACSWSANLSTFISPDNNETNIKSNGVLKIESDLSGLAINLPEPLGKGYETKKIEIITDLDNDQDKTIEIKYGSDLKANIGLQKTGQYNLNFVELLFGNDTETINPTSGYSLHGKYETLDFNRWMEFIKSDKNENIYADIPLSVDLKLDNFKFNKYNFSNTSLKLTEKQGIKNLVISGNDVDGEISIPDDLTQMPVTVSMNKLHLIGTQEQDENQDSHNLDPRDIPALDVLIKDFAYEDINLGQMEFHSSRNENGLVFNTLNFNRKGLSIKSTGKWQVIDDRQTSDFDIKLHAGKLENMLSTFKFDVAPIEDGETHMNMQANWSGSPMDFNWANTSGKLYMNISKGRFLDIEPAAGRLFGLLSLQTLPRRLSLDFTDLFSKGFAFDEIAGNFTLEKGNAYTNNLIMTGPSAKVNVTGRVGLKDKDYDQLVTVTPQISDSLPVASALFGPIGVGVGAVIFLTGELFKSVPENIDKLLRYQYTITGLWDDPVVKKYSGSDKQG